MSQFKFHEAVLTDSQWNKDLWEEVKAIEYEAPRKHVACNRWWYESVSRIVVNRDNAPAAGIFGYDVFITDDVDDPKGYEVRPGLRPEETP